MQRITGRIAPLPIHSADNPVLNLLRLWSDALLVLETIRDELLSSSSSELENTYSTAVVKVQSFAGLAMGMLAKYPAIPLPRSDAISPLLRKGTQSGIDNRLSIAEMIL
jgi:hypothetical protein